MTHLHPGSKLNLYLKINGIRPDGYHLLDTVFLPLSSPHDEMTVETGTPGEFVLFCDKKFDSPNILRKTWEIFSSRIGKEPGVRITLRKDIPVGAGLGGASSDAAALLKWLNDGQDNPLPFEELISTASSIGADVPFFLHNRPCHASGIGDNLQPLSYWPEFWIVTIWPDISLSTKNIFRIFDALSPVSASHSTLLTNTHQTDKKFSGLLANGVKPGENDLEFAALNVYPRLREVKRRLEELLPSAMGMSGSGSSFFGIFLSAESAHNAYRKLSGIYDHLYLEHIRHSDNFLKNLTQGHSQEVKAPDFDSGIKGSNPFAPAN